MGKATGGLLRLYNLQGGMEAPSEIYNLDAVTNTCHFAVALILTGHLERLSVVKGPLTHQH
ncbi:hypothetical protein SynBOUM118_00446 [Synechococcus sp. BOUM118]|nr:hypothetical protein SynBOUM118_00446 [Synechococcus sp. BOUM118]